MFNNLFANPTATSYQDRFTGSTISPANASYNAISWTGTTVQLNWPTSVPVTPPFAADFLELVAPPANALLRLPRASEVGDGQRIFMINNGQNRVTVLPYGTAATNIVQLDFGEVAVVVLTDNSSDVGAWTAAKFAYGGSSVDLATLAGQGIFANVVAGVTKLNTRFPYLLKNTAIVASDFSNLLEFSIQGTYSLPLLSSLATATSIQEGWFVIVKNTSGGAVTIQTAGSDRIDNGLNLSSITLQSGDSAFFVAGPTYWYALKGGGSSGGGGTTSYSYGQITMATDVTIVPPTNVLTFIDFVGAPTTVTVPISRVLLPSRTQLYIVRNLTTNTPLGLPIEIGVNNGTGGVAGAVVDLPTGGFSVIYTNSVDARAGFNFNVTPGGQQLIAYTGSEAAPTFYWDNDPKSGFYSDFADNFVACAINQIQALRIFDFQSGTGILKYFEVGKPDTVNSGVPSYDQVRKRQLQVYGDRLATSFNYHNIDGNTQFSNKVTMIGGTDGGVI